METFKKVMRGVGKVLKKLKVPIILLVIGFIVLTFVMYTSKSAKKLMKEMSSADQEIDTVEVRNLVETITATGTVESAKKRTVASTIIKDTKITSVRCEVGDYVSEGDILVTFSDDSINKTISQLQEDIAESKATESVNDTANTRTYYYSYGTESITLRDLQLDIEQKQKELNEACSAYGDAKRKLEELKNERDQHPDCGETETIIIVDGQQVYTKKYYDQLIEQQQSVVDSACKTEEAAQNAYDKAVRALEDEIYKGSNTLAGATETYQKNEITSNDSTKKLQRQLEEQRDRLDDYVITAPISGMVTQIDVEENNSFAGGNLVTIQDCSTLYVSTEIDEYDIPSIAIGQKVMFKTDATREDELEGIIDEIAVASSSAAGSGSTSGSTTDSTYKVKVKVLTEDDRLKLGMTARLSIIVKEVENVLTVPYDAVVDKGDGEYAVYALDEATVRKIQQRKDAGKQIEGKISDMSKDGASGIPDMEKSSGEGPEGGDRPPEGPLEKAEEKLEGKPGAESPKSLKDIFKTAYGSDEDEGDLIADNEIEIPVEIGIESDYYTEVRSPKLKEGMTVIVKSEVEATNPFEIMMGL
ncbi:MAG: HlyD family efflux transporter periplasmic adaptor subunit [Lachnospiraceae bacterium]|nr:HlyD family efflux transporter periplasmic adaptor subunit [Lachnospiraceae bacterium]